MKKAKSETTLVRAALYIRVSGEEQKSRGYLWKPRKNDCGIFARNAVG